MAWRRRGKSRRLTWAAFTVRISSSNEAVKASDGHAAITRPVRLGSAMATLAAKLATLPAPATSTEAPRALGFEVTPCRIPEPGPEPGGSSNNQAA